MLPNERNTTTTTTQTTHNTTTTCERKRAKESVTKCAVLADVGPHQKPA